MEAQSLLSGFAQLGPALGAVVVMGFITYKLLQMFEKHSEALYSVQENMDAHTTAIREVAKNVAAHTETIQGMKTTIDNLITSTK